MHLPVNESTLNFVSLFIFTVRSPWEFKEWVKTSLLFVIETESNSVPVVVPMIEYVSNKAVFKLFIVKVLSG